MVLYLNSQVQNNHTQSTHFREMKWIVSISLNTDKDLLHFPYDNCPTSATISKFYSVLKQNSGKFTQVEYIK